MIAEYLQRGTPFALFRERGGEVTFIAGDHPSPVTFSIHPWLAVSGINLTEASPIPVQPLTCVPALDRDEYIHRVGTLVKRLQQRGGKTVYSRIINGSGALPPDEIADRLMSLDQPTLRVMWYHPSTGLWVASTPEILLDVDTDSQRLRTMALAGTRPADTPAPWDKKNIVEQQIVVNTIAADLRQLGITPEMGDTNTLRSGQVEHRCTIISGDINGVPPQSIANALSPTPALGGYPRKEALDDIAELETASRECYGGYVAISDSGRWRAYVVIRCARIDTQGNYRIFAGGGITASSHPEKEWCETVAKSRTILSVLLP